MGMVDVVIAGAGTAGLAARAALGNRAKVTVIDRHKGPPELANSSPCTFMGTLRDLPSRLNMREPLREAILSGKCGLADEEKFTHFSQTDEGPERRERLKKAGPSQGADWETRWLADAVVQNHLERFAFLTQETERSFPTELVKFDPIALHAILAALKVGAEGSGIMYGTTITGIDEYRKLVHTDHPGRGAVKYDVLIDATGSAMVSSPHFVPLEWHNCYEHLIRVEKPFPDWFVKQAAFRIDMDPNANPKDPTNTSCVWIYPIDARHVIIGPDDYVGWLVLQNPLVTKDDIMRILRDRLIADLNNDPRMKGLFDSYTILESRFNTIPQSGIGMRRCWNGIMRIGDAGLDATPLSAEGIRRGIEFGAIAARAIMASRDSESLARKYLGMRDALTRIDWVYHMARMLVFNLYNDKVWDAQAHKFGGIPDKTMDRFLRNNADLISLVPALPFGTIVREAARRMRHSQLFKEVYDGNAMRGA